MKDKKLQTISNLFDGKEIRSIWVPEKEDYQFSVVDVITALTDAKIPRNYWSDLKRELINQGSELHEKIVQLKMKSKKDGKYYLTDTLDTKGIFRLIESVPSPKAEPFKLWLAKLGSDRIDEVFDPEKAIRRAINYYKNRGYDDKWIQSRIHAIFKRNELTNVWKENGIDDEVEYAILTNDIYKEWSGMTASEYKSYKGIRKENLRDNMSDIEIILTDLGETVTRDIARKERPVGFKENKKVAKRGGNVAKKTKEFYEETTGLKAITKNSFLNYKYSNSNMFKEKFDKYDESDNKEAI